MKASVSSNLRPFSAVAPISVTPKTCSPGTLPPAAGGAILANGESRADHDARIAADPFVAQGIVTAETYEIDPKRTVAALDFVKTPA